MSFNVQILDWMLEKGKLIKAKSEEALMKEVIKFIDTAKSGPNELNLLHSGRN